MNDLAMINQPHKWPYFPFLPMKRWLQSMNVPEVGVIWSSSPTKVTFISLLDLPKTAKEFESLLGKVYTSSEEMLTDGWVVD